MPSFPQQQQKKDKTCKERGKCDLYTGKKAGNRTYLWEDPDVGLAKIQSNCHKYVQRTEESHA